MRTRPTPPALLALLLAAACPGPSPASSAGPPDTGVDTGDSGDNSDSGDTGDTGFEHSAACEAARADAAVPRVLPAHDCASRLQDGAYGWLSPTALPDGSLLGYGADVYLESAGPHIYHWRGPMGVDSDIGDSAIRTWGDSNDGLYGLFGLSLAPWGDGFAATPGRNGIERYSLDAADPILTYLEGTSLVVEMAHGDFTGDGVEDLAVGHMEGDVIHPNAVAILDGNARGALGSGEEAGLLQLDAARGGAQTVPRTIGDVDGDGIDDLDVRMDGRNQIFRGPLDGVHTDADADASFGELELLASAGDFDGDGRADVVLYDRPKQDPWENAMLLVSPQGDGEFGWPDAFVTLSGAWLHYHVSGAGDLDGDGAADLLVEVNLDDLGGINTYGTWILTGPAAGSVAPTSDDPQQVLLSDTYLGNPLDIDEDGLADLVFDDMTYHDDQFLYILPGSTIAWFFQ